MDELQQHEAAVEAGLKAWAEAGRALAAIRDKRLYQSAAATWDAYCKARWRFSGRRANQLIAAARLARQAGQFVGTMVPANERQAREVKGMTPAARDKLLERFQASDRPTAAQLRRLRQEVEALPAEKKLDAALADEHAAAERLKAQAAERARGQIEKTCGRLRDLHADLPQRAAADEALMGYLGVVRRAA